MKPTDINIAEFYGLTRQTVSTYRRTKNKQNLYLAMVEYFMKMVVAK